MVKTLHTTLVYVHYLWVDRKTAESQTNESVQYLKYYVMYVCLPPTYWHMTWKSLKISTELADCIKLIVIPSKILPKSALDMIGPMLYTKLIWQDHKISTRTYSSQFRNSKLPMSFLPNGTRHQTNSTLQKSCTLFNCV